MPKVSPLLPAFNAGEFSARMAARVDFSKYPLAGACVENIIPLPQGGIARRPGTRFIAEVKDSAAKARLLDFQFSTEQAYVIEAGERYFRFLRNKGQIVSGATDAAIANGAFTADIAGWSDISTGTGSIAHDAANGMLDLVPGGAGGTDIAWAEQAVSVGASFQDNSHVLRFRVVGEAGNAAVGLAGDSIQLRIGTASGGAQILSDVTLSAGWHVVSFTPGATTFYVQFRNLGSVRNKSLRIDDVSLIDGAPVELTTPYLTAELFQLKIAQTADVMYVAHPDHPVMKLERRGHTSWSLVEVSWQDGPYLPQNDAATTLQPSATAGLGITITASAAIGINGGRGFLASDAGRLVRIKNGTDWGYAVITETTSATAVKADVRRDFAATTANADWALGAWSATSGYPAGVTFFEQRLVAWSTRGAIGGRPQTFWMSQSADIENMRPDSLEESNIEVQDDDALDFTMAADQVNVILWMSPGSQLVLGTTGGEWVVRSDGPIVKPTDIDVKRSTTHGSADVQPVRVGHVVLFLQRAKRKIREFAFNFDANDFRAPDLTILADHVLESGVSDMAYQQDPDSLLWAVRLDGQLAALTFLREQDIVAWSRHVLGGSFAGGNPAVETVATIPGNAAAGTENEDEVWIVVKRTVDGATRRYVEVFEPMFEGPAPDRFDTEAAFDAAVLAAQKEAHYVDSGLIYDGPATQTIAGLEHLEGETVKILADGAIHADRAVAGGQIALDAPASKVRVGLGYSHRFKGLKLDFGSAAGTAVGKQKRIHGVTFILLHAMKLRQGPAFGELIANDFRVVGDAMDTAAPLFTGEYFVEFDGDWDRDTRIVISDDSPVPFFLLGVAPELKTSPQA